MTDEGMSSDYHQLLHDASRMARLLMTIRKRERRNLELIDGVLEILQERYGIHAPKDTGDNAGNDYRKAVS